MQIKAITINGKAGLHKLIDGVDGRRILVRRLSASNAGGDDYIKLVSMKGDAEAEVIHGERPFTGQGTAINLEDVAEAPEGHGVGLVNVSPAAVIGGAIAFEVLPAGE